VVINTLLFPSERGSFPKSRIASSPLVYLDIGDPTDRMVQQWIDVTLPSDFAAKWQQVPGLGNYMSSYTVLTA
jgi:hypothetical protein